MWHGWIAVIAVAVCQTASAAFYETYSGKEISPARFAQFKLFNLVPFCAIEVKECDENERRRLDYTCNNLHFPPRGATYTPYRRMLPPVFDPSFNPRPSSSGAPLPLGRAVRTSIISDGRVASEDYTLLVPNALLLITGDVTSVHDTVNYVAVTRHCCQPGGDADPKCLPVQVPEDDVHLRRSNVRCLNLTRAITYQDLGCVPNTLSPERVNTSPPMLELSIVYGNVEDRARQAREGQGGRLSTEIVNGREWPPTGAIFCLQNRQPAESRCHNTPVASTNTLIGPNVLFMWLYRNHNEVARKLEELNPCWDDERLYRETKEINIAYVNQILYYELMTALMGWDFLLKNKVIYDTLGHVNDYDPSLIPQVSIEYVAITRWFHTMQEGRLKKYDNKGNLLDQLNFVDLILRTGALPNNRTLEGITQAFFRQPTAAADYLIDPEMGERVLGGLQFASDVMSSDIMKTRDVGLPPYTKYRAICGLPVPKEFDDLLKWMPEEQVDAIKLTYERVEDMDVLAGILAELPMPGAGISPTLSCVMADQLLHWRRADRFWYENNQHPGAFTTEQLYQIRHMSMARLICDHGDDVDSVQPYAFRVPGPGNEIVDCKRIAAPQLDEWKDSMCDNKALSFPTQSTNKAKG